MSDDRKRLSYALAILLVIGVSFFVGYKIGGGARGGISGPLFLENSNTPSDLNLDFGPFWKAWRVIDEKFVPSSTST
ncbi:MAG: hypothetical protein AAB635_00085, partial [Patescibacteria group bacterium]